MKITIKGIDEECPAIAAADESVSTTTAATLITVQPVKAAAKIKFNTAAELEQYLNTEYKCEYKLFPKTPILVKQYGPTCKITAITSVLTYHYDAKNILSKPLPIIKGENKAITMTARKVAKQVGSEVGRIYNEKMARDFIKMLGVVNKDDDIKEADVIFQRFNQVDGSQRYIQFLKKSVDDGISPPIIFFDVDRDYDRDGLPNPSGQGLHEHGAIVVGYCGNSKNLSFILGHWSNYYIVNANELALSAANLKIGQQPDRWYYRIDGNGTKGWFHAENDEEILNTIWQKLMTRKTKTNIGMYSSLEVAATHAIATKLKSSKRFKDAEVTVVDEKTNEKITFKCSATPGCLYPINNDLRSTACVIVPRSVKLLKSPGYLSLLANSTTALTGSQSRQSPEVVQPKLK